MRIRCSVVQLFERFIHNRFRPASARTLTLSFLTCERPQLLQFGPRFPLLASWPASGLNPRAPTLPLARVAGCRCVTAQLLAAPARWAAAWGASRYPPAVSPAACRQATISLKTRQIPLAGRWKSVGRRPTLTNMGEISPPSGGKRRAGQMATASCAGAPRWVCVGRGGNQTPARDVTVRPSLWAPSPPAAFFRT